MAYFTTPNGDYHSVQRIGGVRATDSGYLLLGTDANDLIEYDRCSPDVAKTWRQATIEFLEKQADRIGRRLPSPDWASLALEADPAWARANGYAPSLPGANAPVRPTPQAPTPPSSPKP